MNLQLFTIPSTRLPLIFLIVLLLFTNNVFANDGNKITLTAKQIEQLKVSSMIDLLNQLPGVKAGTTTIGFNGFGTKEILVLLDGRVLNDSTSSWRAVNWSMILVANIEKLEIIKVSTGGRYGSFSNGGVVKITTKQTSGDLQGNIHGSLGSANYKEISIATRKKMTNFGLNLSAKWSTSDGFRDNNEKTNYKIGLRFKNHNKNQIPYLLALDLSKVDKQSSGPEHRLTPSAYAENENIGASIILPFKNFKISTHFNQFSRLYYNPDSNFLKKLTEKQLKQRFFMSPNIATIGNFDLGIDAIVQGISGLNLQQRTENSLSLYLGKEFVFNNFLASLTDLTLKLDIKGNYYSEFNNILNKSLSLTLPLPVATVSFSFSSFNTLPSATKRYYSSTTLQGNPNLKMEEGVSYSIATSFEVNKSLAVSSSLFYNKSTNLIKYTREGVIGTYENIGSTTTQGLQVDVKYNITTAIDTSLGYTYSSEIDDETGNFVTYSPEHQINLKITLKPVKGILIATNTTYKSTRYYNSSNTGELEGQYFRTNLRADYAFSKQASAYLKVNNLFDADFHGTAGYPVDPLSYYLGFKYNF